LCQIAFAAIVPGVMLFALFLAHPQNIQGNLAKKGVCRLTRNKKHGKSSFSFRVYLKLA
jgi:hypothetical protein